MMAPEGEPRGRLQAQVQTEAGQAEMLALQQRANGMVRRLHEHNANWSPRASPRPSIPRHGWKSSVEVIGGSAREGGGQVAQRGTKGEAEIAIDDLFDAIDVNGDGTITREELLVALQSERRRR
jgi:hypothetical protein